MDYELTFNGLNQLLHDTQVREVSYNLFDDLLTKLSAYEKSDICKIKLIDNTTSMDNVKSMLLNEEITNWVPAFCYKLYIHPELNKGKLKDKIMIIILEKYEDIKKDELTRSILI